jgi:hypothetical protein
MEECFGPAGAAFLQWLAPIVSSFFPWPILLLIVLFSRPTRSALGNFATNFAALPRAVTAINVAGLKINLDPHKAREVLAISSEVVFTDFERVIDHQIEMLKVWDKFEAVIDKALKPMIDQSLLSPHDPYTYRVTLHMPDTLEVESLYQLIEYFPPGPFPKSRGRRKSIRFGAIGKAWRLQRSEYSPTVPTEREKLIADWGMTAKEADVAGHGRQTFLAVIIVDNARVPLGIFYMDATPPKLLGDRSSKEIADAILKECAVAKLTDALVKVRIKMQEQVANPKLN